MLIVEKIRKDYDTSHAIIYSKNTPTLYVADIPLYPEDTILEQDENGLFRATDYWGQSENIKRNVLLIDEFHHYTKDILSARQFEDALSRFGQNCVPRFLSNPFFLLEVPFKDGPIRFPTLDKNIRIRTFEQRLIEIKEAVRYILEWNADRGNTWMSYGELNDLVCKMLKKDGHPLTKDDGSLATYISYWKDAFYFDSSYVTNDTFVATKPQYRYEKNIYDVVRSFSNTSSPYDDFNPPYVDSLSEKQNQAIKNLLTLGGHFSILTGGPGTGKTTILKALTDAFTSQYPNDGVQLVSPTGKAAKRVREVLNNPNLNVSTIHKFLGYDATGKRNEALLSDETKATIERTKLLIIDEASMTDIEIFKDLLALISLSEMKIILVGDTDQLPSVGPGDLLRDLIGMGVYTEKLTESFRFIGTIAENAERINHNDDNLETDDSFIIKVMQKEFLLAEIAQTDADLFITPYRKDTVFGSTPYINRIVQQKVNPNGQMLGSTCFRLGDTIIFNRTNYASKYFNGEMGQITDYDAVSGEFTIQVDNREVKTYAKDDLDLGYAITIHKSQGSEYNHVCIVLPEYSSFVTKKMLYTAVTRAKQKVTILTTEGTLTKVIANNADLNRKTIIKELTAGNIR